MFNFEERIAEIKESLLKQGYNKELDLEFIELWKGMPEGINDETHDNIDEIRNLLMDGYKDKE